MRALKTIVILLGALLIGGLGLLVYGLSHNWHRLETRPVAASVPPAAAGWGRVALGLPAGSRVKEMMAAGNLLVIRVASEAGDSERLIVLNPATGVTVGTFAVNGSP